MGSEARVLCLKTFSHWRDGKMDYVEVQLANGKRGRGKVGKACVVSLDTEDATSLQRMEL